MKIETTFRPYRGVRAAWMVGTTAFASLVGLAASHELPTRISHPLSRSINESSLSPYGQFPQQADAFQFIPCTPTVSLPPIDDGNPNATWAAQFDPDPQHWGWGIFTSNAENSSNTTDPYAGRGIYLCGYLDVPLDYLNDSDPRIARLAVTKFQVSGLARIDSRRPVSHGAGAKSERTIVIEPGGPGGSGTRILWDFGEQGTQLYSQGRFDVLGWDPRGVNASLPSVECFPHGVDRDRWSLLRAQYRETTNQTRQLELADAMNNATLYACSQRLGDLGRFISTAYVARDLEEIRKALGEEKLTGYFISYGTGIAQTYVNMFPDRVGRMILDGPEYVKNSWQVGGWALTSLDNVTDEWRDGFLGECVAAGPENCALARPSQTVEELEARMHALFESILNRPAIGYTEASGPSIITYSLLTLAIYDTLYDPSTWPATAQVLNELEAGNSTLAALTLDRYWEYQPSEASTCPAEMHSPAELQTLVICSDGYDAPEPEGGLGWYDQFWTNVTDRSWISGNSRFYNVLPCRHFTTYWPNVAEVYRGGLNHSLSNPVLILAGAYDPATPLRDGKRLLGEMGKENARLVVHHGYGHTSRVDRSSCTEAIVKSYLLNGTLPEEAETDCYADKKPYQMG
ncbi:Alpha/Beta hydrolase protein [Bombardia bombarda]|uniref:Alpha/Beta hydrolase protein n=1 Tax=Bombardia bombarda TaxID=252184 RepID=A0AA39X7E9_9PEZI|nr:Alpha/Beta hydrolase protein [Bombardia bombarda]